MKSRKIRLISCLLLIVCVVLINGVGPVHALQVVKIRPEQMYQMIEGFGTSLAWWANIVGGWTSYKKNDLLDELFSVENGIGLNIVRYNIGGGENPEHNHMRVGADIPGFQPSPGVWDWSADANQRGVLQEAMNRGANRVEAFSNAPPYWMTYSNCAAGATLGENNLQDERYDDFADYLVEVLKHFRDCWNIEFDTLSIFNEPISIWWHSKNNQEGCHFDRDKQNSIIQKVKSRMATAGLVTGISAPEEYSVDDTISSFNSYDSMTKSYVCQINTHSYSGSKRTNLRNLAVEYDKKLWMSETGAGDSSHNHELIDTALSLANLIRRDLKELQPSAWVYWQAVEDEDRAIEHNHNWGLVHAKFTGEEEYYITKQYYAMGNYSKYIRPGSKIIGLDDLENRTLVAYDDSTGRLVLVITNDTTSDLSMTYDLGSFSSITGSVAVYRTSATENLKRQSDIAVTNKTFSVTAKAQSITTYVVSGVNLDSSASKNYIGNGGFDYSGTEMSSWVPGGYSNSNYIESGGKNGNRLAHYSAVYYQAYTYQIANGLPNGNYTLSAWVKSSGGQNAVQMQVKKYGGPQINHNIPATSDWLKITIPNITVVNNKIEVAFWSDSPGGKWINVDDVVLVAKDPVYGENLLVNSGFEMGSFSPWKAEWNTSLAGVEENYPYEGVYNAYLHPNTFQDVAIYQTKNVSMDCKYIMEAFCATNISNGIWIGVDVNGVNVGETYINNTGAYQRYIIEFNAYTGQSIKLWYYAGRKNGWGTIDEVLLYQQSY
mgnify:FL=1|jgi:O-glycosyl hydrolase